MTGCTCYTGGGYLSGWLGDWLVGSVSLDNQLVRWIIGRMVGHVHVYAAGWLVG
jgi:hypothetical protein